MSETISIEKIDKSKYSVSRTAWGTWFEEIRESAGKGSSEASQNSQKRRDHHREFVSSATVFGRPLVNISLGKDPATGRRAVAKGWLAIGGCAAGVISIGQFATGYVSIGQFSAGRVISIGQFSIAPINVGQFAIGGAVVGQVGIAVYGIFQIGTVVAAGIGQNIVKLADLAKMFFG